MKMTVNTFLFSGVLPLMVWMVRMCLNCVTYPRIIHLSYFMVWYLLHNSLWLSRAHTSFSIPNAYNFYRFWGILRNNNCHREMIIHVFPGHISSSLMFVVLTGLTKAQYLIALLQCTCTLHWSTAQCSHTCTWLMAVPFHQLCFINTCAFSLWNYLSFLIISVAFIFI